MSDDLRRHRLEDRADVEARGREQPRRLGQHAEARRRSTLALSQLGPPQRLRALIRDDAQERDLLGLERLGGHEGEHQRAEQTPSTTSGMAAQES